ncbi:hypothetical protein [Nocardioides sp.]|jgi:hypothetical protein|uniref:hypothetical protein n=1 Tax=Nocardioides sp. TaxID=35761 RepID=UPI0035185654|nr:hypothetical protein [Nocardioides sp.]
MHTERDVLDLAGVEVDLDQPRPADRFGLLVGPLVDGQRVDVVGDGVLASLAAGVDQMLVVLRLGLARSCARRRSARAACRGSGR